MIIEGMTTLIALILIIVFGIMGNYEWVIYTLYTYGSIMCICVFNWIFTPRCKDNRHELEQWTQGKGKKDGKNKHINYMSSEMKTLMTESVGVMTLSELFGDVKAKVYEGGERCCRKVISNSAGQLDIFGSDGSRLKQLMKPMELVDVSGGGERLVVFNNRFLCYTDDGCNVLDNLGEMIIKIVAYVFLAWLGYKIVSILINVNKEVKNTTSTKWTEEGKELMVKKYNRCNIGKSILYVSFVVIYGTIIFYIADPFKMSGANAQCVVDRGFYARNGCFDKLCPADDFSSTDNGMKIDPRCLRPDVLRVSRIQRGMCCFIDGEIKMNRNRCKRAEYQACPVARGKRDLASCNNLKCLGELKENLRKQNITNGPRVAVIDNRMSTIMNNANIQSLKSEMDSIKNEKKLAEEINNSKNMTIDQMLSNIDKLENMLNKNIKEIQKLGNISQENRSKLLALNTQAILTLTDGSMKKNSSSLERSRTMGKVLENQDKMEDIIKQEMENTEVINPRIAEEILLEPGYTVNGYCGSFALAMKNEEGVTPRVCNFDRFYILSCARGKTLMPGPLEQGRVLCSDTPPPTVMDLDETDDSRIWGLAGEFKGNGKNVIMLGKRVNIEYKIIRDQDSLQSGAFGIFFNYAIRMIIEPLEGTAGDFMSEMYINLPGQRGQCFNSSNGLYENFVKIRNVVKPYDYCDSAYVLSSNSMSFNMMNRADARKVYSEIGMNHFVAGRLEAGVEIFGIKIDDIKVIGKVCKSEGAIKIGDVCYVRSNVPNNDVTLTRVGGATYNSSVEYYGWFTNRTYGNFNGAMIWGSLGAQGNNIPFDLMQRHLWFDEFGNDCNNVLVGETTTTCNNNKAFLSYMVTYPMDLSPETPVTNCNLDRNNVVCTHDTNTTSVVCDREGRARATCKERFGVEIRHALKERHVTEYSDGFTSLAVKHPENFCRDCRFTDLKEVYYRCAWCVRLMVTIVGIGYLILLLLGIVILLSYVNFHNLGWLGRKMRIKWKGMYTGNYKTTKCEFCNLTIYNLREMSLHNQLCKQKYCSYCLYTDKQEMSEFGRDKVVKSVWGKKFESTMDLKEHCKIHKKSRQNKVVGFIYLLKCLVVAYTWQLVYRGVEGQFFDGKTNLRSLAVGVNVSIPTHMLDCLGDTCSILGNFETVLPILDGSNILLSGNVEGTEYRQVIEIREPKLATSCEYEYTSMEVLELESRTTYVCYGGGRCDNVVDMLYNPLRPGVQNSITWNRDNPGRSFDCPISVACNSPLLNFLWLGAGCWTINAGTALGFDSFRGDHAGKMVSVFSCKVTDVNYKVCTENGNCEDVSSHGTEIENGEIKFENSLEGPVPVEFRVGVYHEEGGSKPMMLTWDPPHITSNTDNTIFALKSFGVPLSDKCTKGTSYNGGNCIFNLRSNEPRMECRRFSPSITSETVSAVMNQLSRHINCNFEESELSWDKSTLNRKETKGSITIDDTIDVATPSLDLKGSFCTLGQTRVRLEDIRGIKLEKLTYNGDVNRITCRGLYNRNGMAELTVEGTGQAYGNLEIKCKQGISEMCMINMARTNKCNVTVLLRGNYVCSYKGKDIDVDCNNLVMERPDFTSGKVMGGSGSTVLNTWESSVLWIFGTWWGILLIIVGSLILLLIILYVVAWIYFSFMNLNSGIKNRKKKE